MLRLALQLGLLAASIGLVASSLDRQTMQKLESSIRDLASMFRQSGLPVSQEAASGMDKAADALQSATQPQTDVTQKSSVKKEEEVAHPKAFYNKAPEECFWEKVIDPSDGRVECSVPDRRALARASRNQSDRKE